MLYVKSAGTFSTLAECEPVGHAVPGTKPVGTNGAPVALLTQLSRL